jgi:hypothetical protein
MLAKGYFLIGSSCCFLGSIALEDEEKIRYGVSEPLFSSSAPDGVFLKHHSAKRDRIKIKSVE